MRDTPFQFEVENLIAQFISAMDDIIVKRYNANREAQDQLLVRMLYSPKERVLLDLVDKAQNIQLPVVAISIASIARDQSRVFNKIHGSNYASSNTRVAGKLPQPVPINITVNFSILTRYQKDMDQILSNFIPYFDPYITLSWRIPDMQNQEIRSTVEWSNSVALNYPLAQNVPATTIARLAGDTSFTIKGWLFKSIPDTNNGGGDPLIYTIYTNFYALCSITGYDSTIPKDSEYWEEKIITVPNINVYSLSATTLSADTAYFYNNVYIDNTIFAEYGVFDTLSANSISATKFYGDGSGLINLQTNIKKFSQVIGDGSATTYTVTHNFSTLNALTQIYDNNTGIVVYPTIQNIDQNNTQIYFKNAPALSAYKVVMMSYFK